MTSGPVCIKNEVFSLNQLQHCEWVEPTEVKQTSEYQRIINYTVVIVTRES